MELALGAKEIYKDTKIVLQSEALAAGELENTHALGESVNSGGRSIITKRTDTRVTTRKTTIWYHDLPSGENEELL